MTAVLTDIPEPAALGHATESPRPRVGRSPRVFGDPRVVDLDALPTLDPGAAESIVTASEEDVDMLTWTPRYVDVVRRITWLTSDTHTVGEHRVRVHAAALIPSVLYAFRVHDDRGAAPEEIEIVGPAAEWVVTGEPVHRGETDPRPYTLARLPLTPGASPSLELIVDRATIDAIATDATLLPADATALVVNVDLAWPLHAEPTLTLRVGAWSATPPP